MAKKWIKLHLGLIDNDAFRAVSPSARLTFFTILALAGKLDADGLLVIRGLGAMSVESISDYTGLPLKQQRPAIIELLQIGFITSNDEGVYAVSRWNEKVGEDSKAAGNRERQARFRASRSINNASRVTQSNALRVTHDEKVSNAHKVTDIEEEGEEDRDTPQVLTHLSPPLKIDEPAKPKPTKRVRPEVAPIAADAFGADETLVAQFIAVCAAENQGGLISEGRIDTLRRRLLVIRDRFPEQFSESLGITIDKQKPEPNYALTVAKRLKSERKPGPTLAFSQQSTPPKPILDIEAIVRRNVAQRAEAEARRAASGGA